MAKIVLCDLDGTLSDTRHRERFVKQKPRDYDSFFAAAGGDAPIWPVIEVVNALAKAGYEIHITTGRRDDTREVTERWLAEHGVTYHRLVMREFHDHTPDDELKRRWYEAEYRDRDVLCVLEDRNRVVRMWRELGVTCLHVADADF
ncbi:MAG TPA: HAD family acid phosphatase [Trueperaceae bacterium]|nr:HAD family acid phosphatase [Trueperaceae bacterium]